MAIEVKEIGEEKKPTPQKKPTKKKPTVETYYTTSRLNIRKEADLTSDILGVLNQGARIKVKEVKSNMGKLTDVDGWVCMDFVRPE